MLKYQGVTFIPPYPDEYNSSNLDTTICGKITKEGKNLIIACFDLDLAVWVKNFSNNNNTIDYAETYLIFPGTTKVVNKN